MSTEQHDKHTDKQKPSIPVPLPHFPVPWSGTGHTLDVTGACELSDRRLLSWSRDNTMRLWSSEGELLKVLGTLSSGADPNLDIDVELFLFFTHARRVNRGFSYRTERALSWYSHHSSRKAIVREITPQPVPKKAAAAIARTIKKYATDDTAVYLSLRSTWAAEVLLELDRKVLLHIRGIQCTDAAVYEEITGVMPELELDLLQYPPPGHRTLNTLYGVQAQRVLMYCCNDLRRLEGSNCLIDTVEVVDCTQLGYVRVGGMVGEAEMVNI